ncbi:MAG: NADPH-dependent F420 reductase [Betaproteobacteria bacterium]|nr:NADPH-dependent F420 reductase [Betaproteobacteria bacterium]
MNKTIAVLGGTGAEGGGLAIRWANAGHKVILGSRSKERADSAAKDMNSRIGADRVSGDNNLAAAQAADIVVLTVPYSGQRATAMEVKTALAGKILVDVTVPLVPPKVMRVQLPAGGSAVAALQAELGETVRVVAAFQNISAHQLSDLAHVMECDVLVSGDSEEAREEVIKLAHDAGMRGVHAGPLVNSSAAEALTSILISINRRYKVEGAGIRITGLK